MGDSCYPNNEGKDERRERENGYRKQQEELRREQLKQLRDLQKSLKRRNEMEAKFMQDSLHIWHEYFKRLGSL